MGLGSDPFSSCSEYFFKEKSWENIDDFCFLAFVCPEGSSSTNVTVNTRDRLTFKTQTGRLTPADVDCNMEFGLGSCTRMAVLCKFKMRGKGQDCSNGDRVTMTYGSTTNKSVIF